MRRADLFSSLQIKPNDFIDSWWHAGDIDTALDMLREALAVHDLGQALPEARIRADHDSAMAAQPRAKEDLEALQRHHQIGVAAVAANELLARRGDSRRFRAFDRAIADESDEPAWLLVTPEEHAKLRAKTGALDPVDAIYDAARSVAELAAIEWPFGEISAEKLAPHEARARADAALREQRYADALKLWPIAVRDGQHGILAELDWIETLRRAGDREAARARWRMTADSWLAGARPVWDTQWQRLEELYTKLALDEPERFARVRAKLPPPPLPRVAGRENLGTGIFDEAVLLSVGAMWLVTTGVKVIPGDRLVIGEEEIAISEPVTESAANERAARQIGIRIVDERASPDKGAWVRFIRGSH